MKATLIRLGIRGFNPKLKKAGGRLEDLRTPEGEPIPPNTMAELRRDMDRRRLVSDQIRQIEEARLDRLKQAPGDGPLARAATRRSKACAPRPRSWACIMVRVLGPAGYKVVARLIRARKRVTWHILKDLPVLRSEVYETRHFGKRTAGDMVRDHVLRLSYTAHDLAAFAKDMGHINQDGSVKPPIIWNENERQHLRARLDALYFILYGVTEVDTIKYILSTFPIVERKDRSAFDGVYLTQELILWYKRALEVGNTEATAPEAEIIRFAQAA